jgi:hypothetical protein
MADNTGTENKANTKASNSDSGKSSGYKTMMVGIGKTHADTHGRLQALADKLGCRSSVLVWESIERLLKDPPKVAPAGAAPAVGSAPGFWVAPIMGDKGATGIEIVEVEARNQSKGRTFLRYKTVEEDQEATFKARERAYGQARRAAEYDCQMLGLDPSKIQTRVVKAPAGAPKLG